MPFEIVPEPGEEVYTIQEIRGAHGHVFGMGISNQAIYLPKQKFVMKGDPWYFRRVPHSEVVAISVLKQKPAPVYALSFSMIVAGIVLTLLTIESTLRGESVKATAYAIAILVAGIVLPIASRGRKTLRVKLVNGKFKWNPPLSVDKKSREEHEIILMDLVTEAKRAGIRVIESD